MKKFLYLVYIFILLTTIVPSGFSQDILFSDPITITPQAISAKSVCAADIDDDGDLDVLSASFGDSTVSWHENLDGLGTFGVRQIITSEADGARSVFTADLDSDGDLDVISAAYFDNEIAWYENTDGLGNFGEMNILTDQALGARAVTSADIDGDGDMDVLFASLANDLIAWFENTDSLGTFSDLIEITDNADGAQWVSTGDLDGDEDLDVISASCYDDKIAWYENIDGLGTFGDEQVLTLEADFARTASAADVDSDGDLDVISASGDDDKIAWYENIDGLGSFGPQQVISTEINNIYTLYPVDMENDGDIDLLAGSFIDDYIAWFENMDGEANYSEPYYISYIAEGCRSVIAADLDADDDLDVLSATSRNSKVSWYRNQESIIISSPTSEDYWELGETYEITWVDNIDENVRIDLFRNQQFQFSIDEDTPSDGSYLWTIPEDVPIDNGYRIFITSLENEDITDVSETFTILEEFQIPDLKSGCEPLNEPIVISPLGGLIYWEAKVRNNTDIVTFFDSWIEIITPAGNTVGPYDLENGIRINGYSALWMEPVTSVPFLTPEGINTFVSKVGLYPDAVWEDQFTFEKLPNEAPLHYDDPDIVERFSTEWNIRDIGSSDDGETVLLIPNKLELSPAYPNPFNGTTNISVSLPEKMDISLSVFDITGRTTATLAEGNYSEGYHSFVFNGDNVASGIYFVRMETRGYGTETRKIVLVK